MMKFVEKNKIFNFFKRKITVSRKIMKKQEIISKILSVMIQYNLKELRK